MKTIRAAITGVGGYVPDYILSNEELSTMVETNDEWIRTRTGIKERRILKGEGKGTSYMGSRAVKNLFEKTNTAPEDIDLLICSTVTPDHIFPATANLICRDLGIKNIPSYDSAAACTGFLYALSQACMAIESGRYKKVVLVGADKMSAIVDYQDRKTCVLFGDGAGAILLEPNTEGYGVQDFILRSDGIGIDYLYLKNGGSKYPLTAENIALREHYVRQEGQSVFKFAVTNMANISAEIMEKHHLKSDDITYLVPHQANKRIIDATADRMGIEKEKVLINIERYGNTTSATIPLCLWDFENKFKKGDNLIFAAFGGGFTWGSAWVRWAY